MINNVTLTGRITKDLEKHETGKGTSVVNFSLAVDRRRKNANGDRETDFIGIQAWGLTADLLCEYCGKFHQIGYREFCKKYRLTNLGVKVNAETLKRIGMKGVYDNG